VPEKVDKSFEDYLMFLIAVRRLRWFAMDIKTEIEIGKRLAVADYSGAQKLIAKELQWQTRDHVVEKYSE
jgi:hypothetical protein